MGLFQKIKENLGGKREQKEIAKEQELTNYSCSVYEIMELRKTPIETIEGALESVNLPLDKVWLWEMYPEGVERGMENAGLSHISIECFMSYVAMKYSRSSGRRRGR